MEQQSNSCSQPVAARNNFNWYGRFVGIFLKRSKLSPYLFHIYLKYIYFFLIKNKFTGQQEPAGRSS
jgi:hypothetical protein